MKINATNGSKKDHRRIRREIGKAMAGHRRLNKRNGETETARIIAGVCNRWMYDLANRPGRLKLASA